MYFEDSDNRDTNIWNLIVFNCEVFNWSISQKLVFTAANRFLANKVKNYNSLVLSKVVEKRKFKKFS